MSKRTVFPSIFDLLRRAEELLGHNKYYGIRRGTVVDTNDPEERYRVKVRVKGVHPADIADELMPWAEMGYGDGGGDNYGDTYVPYNYGDDLWVFFEGGDPDYPVWAGAVIGEGEGPDETRGKVKRRIWKTRVGHKIEMSDEDGALEIRIQDSKGSYLHMDTEGDKWDILVKGDIDKIKVEGDATIEVDGAVNGTNHKHPCKWTCVDHALPNSLVL